MSLIMDAQKAAQREKDRRKSGVSDNVPVLVPLRTKARSDFSWRRTAFLVIGGGAMLTAAFVIVQTSSDTVPRALRVPGPTVVSLATPPATRPSTDASAAAKPPVTPGAEAPATKASAARPANRTVAAAPKVRPPSTRRPAAPPSAEPENATAGLHIAVANPRQMEAARLFAVGVAAHKSGDLASARNAYEQVLAIAPNDVDALNNLGVLLLGIREFDHADVVLRRAVSLAPDNAGAWNNFGTVLRERGRSAEAIAAFQRALAIDPKHDGARVSLAQQYLVIGALPQAKQLLEDVIAGTPEQPEANYALGQVLERLGDKAEALRAYGTFVRTAPPALASYVESVRRRMATLSAAR